MDPQHTDAVTNYLAGLGISSTPENPVDSNLLDFITKELDAHQGKTGGLDGWNVADVGSSNDFFQLAGWAENFASITGYNHMPTAAQLSQMVKNSPDGGWDQKSASKYMYDQLKPQDQAKYHGAQFGMTNTAYWQSAAQYLDTMEQLTGSRSLPLNLMDTAINENWSSSNMQQYLKENDWVKKQFGWTQHNMDFNTFKQYKEDHKAEIQARYGLQATTGGAEWQNQFALANLANPLQKFNAQQAQSPTTATTGYTQPRGGIQTYESQNR